MTAHANLIPLDNVDPALVEALLDRAFEPARHLRTAYKVREGMDWLPTLSFAAIDEHVVEYSGAGTDDSVTDDADITAADAGAAETGKPEKGAIPKSRFDEVIAERNAMRARLEALDVARQISEAEVLQMRGDAFVVAAFADDAVPSVAKGLIHARE